MKSVKIILAVVVIGLIAFFVNKSLVDPLEKPQVALAENQFRKNIAEEIIALSNLPDNKLSKATYNGVQSLIEDLYKPHPPQYPYGRLGNTQLENDQWKENYSKNLYVAYADKFIKQAFYVFNNSEWQINNLAFIRSECQLLRKSQFLEIGSPVDKSFSKIQQILGKYDELNDFIATSRNFSTPNNSLSSNFPFSDLEIKISRIDTYKKNNLDNVYVNKCARLHLGLDNNKKHLINTYLNYLDRKIVNWTGKYKQFEFTSFNEYKNIIYNPLKKELDDFKTNCNNNNYTYDNNRYISISNRLNSDRKEAYLNIS
jgi:hypothetical protein